MKRTAVMLGVAAAMGVFAPVAAGGQSDKPVKARKGATELTVQTQYDERSGKVMYRLGSSGLWME
jgi:hypothetical protein